MRNQNQLFEIADRLQGFFTAKQAEECGYKRSNFHLKLTSGEWTQEERGVYRLARYPVTERPELVLWFLWSRNIEDILLPVQWHSKGLIQSPGIEIISKGFVLNPILTPSK